MTFALQTTGLSIGYRQGGRTTVVAEALDLALHRGEFVCLIGPNGAGKSTLLRTLAGLQPALAGHAHIDGTDVNDLTGRDLARRLSVVLTERIVPGLMSGRELVSLGRYPYTGFSGALSQEDCRKVDWALAEVRAEAFADRPVTQLSDGERQKVYIARALAQDPQLMILDEPTAFLDLPRRVEVMRELRALARSTDKAVLLSTHDLDLALRSADRLWLMPQSGAMRCGTPEDLVLSGAFEHVFETEGVAFDRATGSFRIHEQARRAVTFAGEGPPAYWTVHALQREGYRVETSAEPGRPAVAVLSVRDVPAWTVAVDGVRAGRADSVDELLKLLRSLDRPEVPR